MAQGLAENMGLLKGRLTLENVEERSKAHGFSLIELYILSVICEAGQLLLSELDQNTIFTTEMNTKTVKNLLKKSVLHSDPVEKLIKTLKLKKLTRKRNPG